MWNAVSSDDKPRWLHRRRLMLIRKQLLFNNSHYSNYFGLQIDQFIITKLTKVLDFGINLNFTLSLYGKQFYLLNIQFFVMQFKLESFNLKLSLLSGDKSKWTPAGPQKDIRQSTQLTPGKQSATELGANLRNSQINFSREAYS